MGKSKDDGKKGRNGKAGKQAGKDEADASGGPVAAGGPGGTGQAGDAVGTGPGGDAVGSGKGKGRNKGKDEGTGKASLARRSNSPSEPAAEKLDKKTYLEHLEALQVELNGMARWLQRAGKRLVVIFEGRDTAGKGGAIAAFSERMNPRACHVVALAKPSEREASQWYFQRYVPHLPAAGEVTLFDRSWYNRAGVERVMGFCSDAQYRAFLEQAPVFERMLTDDGVLLFKYWLTVDQAQQEERFAERLADPLKRWKLSPIDVKAREKYVEYGAARDAMLAATHRPNAPWTLVDFNDQRRGRLTLLRHLLDHLPDTHVPEAEIDFPPLDGKLHEEAYDGPLKPIPSPY